MSRWSKPSVDFLHAVGAAAVANLDPLALDVLEAVTDAGRPLAGRPAEHAVADGHRRGLLDDPARAHLGAAHAVCVADRLRFLVALGNVEILDRHEAGAGLGVEDAAFLAPVFPGQHVD